MAERRTRQAYLVGTRSLVMTIPSEFAEAMKIKPKTNLTIELVDGKLVVQNLDVMLDDVEARRK